MRELGCSVDGPSRRSAWLTALTLEVGAMTAFPPSSTILLATLPVAPVGPARCRSPTLPPGSIRSNPQGGAVCLAAGRLLKPAVVVLVSDLAVAFMGLVARGTTAALAQAQPKMDATIFSYDGKEFVRTRTTMVTESGKSAVDDQAGSQQPGV
jgi:hypothetical protein